MPGRGMQESMLCTWLGERVGVTVSEWQGGEGQEMRGRGERWGETRRKWGGLRSAGRGEECERL